MKRWTETRDILDHLSRWTAEGRRTALATVVGVVGSAYRRPGAKLLIADDGRTRGNVSGGCLEEDVREVGLQVIESGVPQLRTYCSGADEVGAWDLGLGCDGRVDIHVSPGWAQVESERDLLRGDGAFAIATLCQRHPVASSDITSERATLGTGALIAAEAPSASLFRHERLIITGAGAVQGTLGDPHLDDETATLARSLLASRASESGVHDLLHYAVFIDVLRPPPNLVIFGAGHDAPPVARLASELGFRVSVIDRRPALLDPARFPANARLIRARRDDPLTHLTLDSDSYVVLMTHNFAEDLRYLRSLLPTPVAYLGVLGPRARTERILTTILAERPLDVDRVHGPVGLDIGGEGAEAVAVSLLAEVMAVRAGRTGVSLRERTSAIHAEPSMRE